MVRLYQQAYDLIQLVTGLPSSNSSSTIIMPRSAIRPSTTIMLNRVMMLLEMLLECLVNILIIYAVAVAF